MAGAVSFQRNYFDDNSVPLTAHEREYLDGTCRVYRTAFRPRPQQRLSARKLPHSASDMAISHRMRTYISESVKPKPSAPLRLWIELGRREPPFPPKWDENYNSNVWRNFSHGEGYRISTPGKRINETVAISYPLKIPPQSEMNQNTMSKYLSESKQVIKDSKKKEIALAKSKRQLKEFKLLKLRSQMRVPPMDSAGNILPPENMKHYDHPEVKLPETQTVSLRLMEEHERDIERHMLGTHRSSPTRLWKLSFKDNNPEFVKVQKELSERRNLPSPRSTHSLSQAEIFFK
ncbi:Testis-expressed protein 52 [Holothuria leucospilota]|uniref:Testis-expressed protein 52 n=1 Tax=Holothuria leucospilota TaxID=206669 RepID=A0A9Q1BF26_HOLLE|nr:Testis-expressed protein 52 [Holothuria leucospilota]